MKSTQLLFDFFRCLLLDMKLFYHCTKFSSSIFNDYIKEITRWIWLKLWQLTEEFSFSQWQVFVFLALPSCHLPHLSAYPRTVHSTSVKLSLLQIMDVSYACSVNFLWSWRLYVMSGSSTLKTTKALVHCPAVRRNYFVFNQKYHS